MPEPQHPARRLNAALRDLVALGLVRRVDLNGVPGLRLPGEPGAPTAVSWAGDADWALEAADPRDPRGPAIMAALDHLARQHGCQPTERPPAAYAPWVGRAADQAEALLACLDRQAGAVQVSNP